MTTTLERVLAEEWVRSKHNGEIDVVCPTGAVEREVISAYSGEGEEQIDKERVSVVLLGKRAFALVLRHEWCGRDNRDTRLCPECRRMDPADSLEGEPQAYPNAFGHRPDCEWGDIVRAAKELG